VSVNERYVLLECAQYLFDQVSVDDVDQRVDLIFYLDRNSLVRCNIYNNNIVFKKAKDVTHDAIDEWDEQLDESGKRAHYVNYLQYFRLEDESDPWSLKEMNPKVNIVVATSEPKKYMLPPRTGWFDPKKHFSEWKEGATSSIRKTVWWARQAGCDTALMIVPGSAIKALVDDEEKLTPPCCAAAFSADVGDDENDIEFTLHSFSDNPALDANLSVPAFTGQIDELASPHEGNDPAEAPDNLWALFPEPEPEYLPKDYPELPAFGTALDVPLPPKIEKPKQQKKKKDESAPPSPRKQKPPESPKGKKKKPPAPGGAASGKKKKSAGAGGKKKKSTAATGGGGVEGGKKSKPKKKA